MKRIFTPVSFLFFFLILLSQSNTSTGQCLIRPVGLNERLKHSSLVVEGIITGQRSLWDDKHQNIYTIYTLNLSNVFKGDFTDSVVNIVSAGGTVGMDREEVTNTFKLGDGNSGVFTLIKSNKQITSTTTLYEAYAGNQGFIQYEKEKRKAGGIFEQYTGIENDLYKKIENATGRDRRKIKDLNWKKVKSGEQTADHTNHSHAELEQENADLLNTDGLYAEDVQPLIAANAAITGFSPTTIQGGKAVTLTINGTGFGASQGTSYVQFLDVNSGGTSYYSPYSTQYISWSDTRIEVQVPSRAGTGTIKVSDGTTTKTSTGVLTVEYSLSNLGYESIHNLRIKHKCHDGYDECAFPMGMCNGCELADRKQHGHKCRCK